MGGKRSRNAKKKLRASGGGWTVWVGGMAFPFLFKESAEEYIAEVLADYPDAEYTLNQDTPAEAGE